MDFTGDMLTRPVAAGVRDLLLDLLAVATKACGRLDVEQDTETLHDFRVSVRRIRSCLKSYLDKGGFGKTGKLLRGLTVMTNPGRDDQVHLQWLRQRLQRRRLSGHERTGIRLMLDEIESRTQLCDTTLPDRVGREFAGVRAKLRRDLDQNVGVARVDELGTIVSLGQAASMLVRGHAAELWKLLQAIESPHDVESAHDARLAAKRLRYLLEPTAKWLSGGRSAVRRLKGLQDLLGTMHDLHTLELVAGSSMDCDAREWSVAVQKAAMNGGPLSSIMRPTPQLQGYLALATMLRRLALELKQLYGVLHRQWQDDRLARFSAQIERVAA